MIAVPFRFSGGGTRRLRRMTASERAVWYPLVGIDPPVAPVRNGLAHRRVLGHPVKFQDAVEQIPHAEFFKMYFGWLGSAEVNFGKNRREFDIAHRALLATVRALDIRGDLHAACARLHDDVAAIAQLRGPRDYVYTVRDDTGRMWLELTQGVYVSELTEVPVVATAFEHTEDGITVPREHTFLFRGGELLGSSAVHVPLDGTLIKRFIADRLFCGCTIEVGDDDQPVAVFLSVATNTLGKESRFENERLAAFGGFPLEGVSRAKRRPWSLYELFAEMIVARMIGQDEVERLDARCAHLARTWLRQHSQRYERNAEGDKPEGEAERLLEMVCAHDVHLLLGYATAPNRHIGAVVLALFRAAMRAMCMAAVPLQAPALAGSVVRAARTELFQVSDGRCRVRVQRSWVEAGAAASCVALAIAAAIALWQREEHTAGLLLATGAMPLGTAGWALALKARHDSVLGDWIAARRTVTCLSELKRMLGCEWRAVLVQRDVACMLACSNGFLFESDVRGAVVLVDELITVGDAVAVGYELGAEDSGHMALRASWGNFRRVEIDERGLYMQEKCVGRVWTIDANSTSLGSCAITSPPQHRFRSHRDISACARCGQVG